MAGWKKAVAPTLVVLTALVAAMAIGCATSQQMGDRALEQGLPEQALDHYEHAINEGTRDPRVYRGAAHAAQQIGAFAKAERYFSQGLRYGGGVPMARELAEFYIQTSNFAQAVHVFRYLIQIEENEEALQPMYSNMGTALMYAGRYIDAESYLLLAQQNDPEDAVPYINLGVLYDRYLRNLPKAVRFYDCFVEMSNDVGQVRTVRNRLRELDSQRNVDTSRVNLECGQEYRATVPEEHDLHQIFGLEQEGDSGEEAQEEIELDLPLEYDPGRGEEGATALFGDKDGEGPPRGEEAPESVEQPTPVDEDYRRAEQAFEAGRFDEAVQILEDAGGEDRAYEELLGKSYYRVGRFDDAVEKLESVVEQRPTPQVVQRLISAYRRIGDTENRQQICQRFDGWPDYEEALDDCP